MIDRYTKAVLTVIAASLLGLLAVQLTPVAHAQSGGCGSSSSPCYVTGVGYGLSVMVHAQ
jgi:uncharacterized protein (DUF779 family)